MLGPRAEGGVRAQYARPVGQPRPA